MSYNLKRIAMNVLMNKEELHSQIKESSDGSVDYRTTIEAPDDQLYDLNVYTISDKFQALVYIYEQGYNEPLMEFNVDLDTLMPAITDKTHRVRFECISHYYIDIDAYDSGEALKRARTYMDDYELINRGTFDSFQTKITTVEEM